MGWNFRCWYVCMLSMALGCLTVPTRAADQAKIDAAIKKGMERLWEDQEEDGSWTYGDNEDRALGMTSLAALAVYENGISSYDKRLRKALDYIRDNSMKNTDTYSVSLAVVVLARVGLKEDRPLIKQLAARLVAAQHLTGGWHYTTPRLAADQSRDAPVRGKRATTMGDLSVTQFVVLALWQAQRVGIDVRDTLRDVRLRLAWAQTSHGGWNYYALPDLADSPSMTLAGAFMWIVSSAWEIKLARKQNQATITARDARPRAEKDSPQAQRRKLKEKGLSDSEIEAELKKKTESAPVDIYDALQRGALTLKETISRTSEVSEGEKAGQMLYEYPAVLPPKLDASKPNPLLDDPALGKAMTRVDHWVGQNMFYGGTLYYTWSVERLGILLGREKFGSTDWFEKGASILLKNQHENGSWGIQPDDPNHEKSHYKHGPDTCFALLFLRKANLGSEVARLLNPEPDRPYYLSKEPKQRYKDLQEVVNLAKANDVIMVEGDGPFPTANVVIDKPLTIRAQLGYEPILKYERPRDKFGIQMDVTGKPDMQCMFIIKKSATIEGLRLIVDPPGGVSGDWVGIDVRGAPLNLLNCSVTEATRDKVTGVRVTDCPRAFLRNNLFLGTDVAVSARGTNAARLALRDCVAFVPRLLEVSGSGTLQFWLIESTIQANEAFDFAKQSADMDAIVENCVFNSRDLIVHLGSGSRSWAGHKNVYDVRSWVKQGDANATAIDDLPAWKRYWKADETKSKTSATPFVIYRQQIGSFRHETSPQDWALKEEDARGLITLRSVESLGANVYAVGAGAGYLNFRDRFDYDRWLTLSLPSQREETAQE